MRILKQAVCDSLQSNVESGLSLDDTSAMILEDYAAGNRPSRFQDNDFIITAIEEPSADLLDAENDYTSSVRLYECLRTLNPVQAADKRLWITLSHGSQWRYLQSRWSPRADPSRIISRWFFAGSARQSFARNALSRLWWAAYLTESPWSKLAALEPFRHDNMFHYTEIMTSPGRSQLWFDISERAFGGSLVYRICFLEAFDRLIRSGEYSNATALSNTLSKLFRALLVPEVLMEHARNPEEIVNSVCELAASFRS